MKPYVRFRSHLPLLGIVISMCLFFVATTYYPGGTADSATSVGYDWAHNFISSLFAAKALNGAPVRYRISLVPNARRFKAGHTMRLYLTTTTRTRTPPALLGFRHAGVGTSSLNTVSSSSRLLLPVLRGEPVPESSDR
jgi:predicted acyl esterase